MRRIYVSTTNRLSTELRNNPLAKGGSLYVLDWDTKELIYDPSNIDIDFPLHTGELPRSHGLRGITFYKGDLVVATSENTILVYDPDTMKRKNIITIPEASHIHQIKSHNELLHICSTGNDRILRLRDYVLEENQELLPSVESAYGFIHGRTGWNEKLHFNSITWDDQGNEYHTYMFVPLIFNWSQKISLGNQNILISPHDIRFNKGDLLVASSSARTLYRIRERNAFPIYWNSYNQLKVPFNANINRTIGFVRALAISGKDLFIGVSPSKIVQQDYETGIDTIVNISSDMTEAIYDIALHPEDWRK